MKQELEPTRDGFGKALVKLGKINPDIVVLSADLEESTRTKWFKEKYPERFIEVGVAEQNMLGIATGLALEGKIPFAASFAVFSPGRNWDQLRISVCYSNANVKIFGGHAGLTVGKDGATHQALEDIAITRALPNLTVIVPCDSEEMEKATISAAKLKGPVYLRGGRERIPIVKENEKFEIGKANILREGKDVAIIACGIMVHKALKASDILKTKGISCRVINMHTIKPIDKKTILDAAKECKFIVTAEEHQITGGLGSAVCEVVAESHPTKVIRVGMKDRFGESGEPNELLIKYGLTEKDIFDAVIKNM